MHYRQAKLPPFRHKTSVKLVTDRGQIPQSHPPKQKSDHNDEVCKVTEDILVSCRVE